VNRCLNPSIGNPRKSTTSPDNRILEITHDLLTVLFGKDQKRTFAVRLWNGEELPTGSAEVPRFTLALTHPGSLRHMLIPPGEMTLTEAYLGGDFDIEGYNQSTIQCHYFPRHIHGSFLLLPPPLAPHPVWGSQRLMTPAPPI
jgi:hypothetical protein